MLLKGVFSLIYSHLRDKNTDSIAPSQELLFDESLDRVSPGPSSPASRPRYVGNAEVRLSGKSKENA